MDSEGLLSEQGKGIGEYANVKAGALLFAMFRLPCQVLMEKTANLATQSVVDDKSEKTLKVSWSIRGAI